MPDFTGQSIGRYHILEQIGEGGMAVVYKAYDTHLDRDVAVKFIRMERLAPELAERTLKRFQAEAKIVSQLTHTHIVKVTDYHEYQGVPYLVMEYLPGGSLKQLTGKPMPFAQAARLLAPVARALEYAHNQNPKIIHRDVKPSNILITRDGEPMLTDFGIAKILKDDASQDRLTLTGAGIGVGTPEYMAPEQWVNQPVPQSDIYSLGVVFYELVTGRVPYKADTPAALLIKQTNDALPRPKQFVADLPEGVEKVIFKAMAKKTEDRYQTMGEFAGVLERLGREADETGKIKEGEVENLPPVTQPEPRPETSQEASITQDELVDEKKSEIPTTQPVPPTKTKTSTVSFRRWGTLVFAGLLCIGLLLVGYWSLNGATSVVQSTIVISDQFTIPAAATSTVTPLLPTTIKPTIQLQTPKSDLTNTLEPRTTVKPIPTFALNLPVSLGTPWPEVVEPIKVSNANRIKMLADYERYDPGKNLIKVTQDDKYYFVASAKGVDVYDNTNQQMIHHYDVFIRLNPIDHTYMQNDIQLSADGSRFMARLSDSLVTVFSVEGKEIYSYNFPGDLDTGGVAFSPNGNNLVVDICSDCNAYNGTSDFKVIDINNNKEIYDHLTNAGGEAYGSYPILSPDGNLLATQIASQLILWDTINWKRITDFPLNTVYLGYHATFSPDSSLLSTFTENVVTIWQIENRQKLRSFTVCGNQFNYPQAIFSNNNLYIAILACKKVNIYKISDGSLFSERSVNDINLSGYNLGDDASLIIYQPIPETGKFFAPWSSWYSTNGFEFEGEGSSLNLEFASQTAGAFCSITIKGSPTCKNGEFILSSDRRVNQANIDQSTHEFNLRSATDSSENNILTFKWTGYKLTPFGFNSKHNIFIYDIWANVNEVTTYLMDVTNGKILTQWPGAEILDNRIIYSPNQNIAAFYLFQNPGIRLILFDMEKRQQLFQLQSSWGGQGGLAFSPDGRFLVNFLPKQGDSLSDFFYITSLEDPTKSTRYQIPSIQDVDKSKLWIGPSTTRYSTDGSLLAIGYGNGLIRLFDTKDETLVYEWTAQNGSITGLSFTPDMKYLASASQDGNIRLWGVAP